MDNLWLKVENIVAKGEIACFEQIYSSELHLIIELNWIFTLLEVKLLFPW